MEEKKTKTTKKIDLLMAVEKIVELAKKSQLNKEFYRKADKYIKYVSDKLDLTKEQSVVLALFINRSDDNRILLRELSEDVECSTARILRYMNDIDVLEKRGLSIWHTMIPALDENVTRTLATKYDFSGGQIENIARHYAINNILHGQTDNTIATLTSYCDNERLETNENRKIGF